MAVSLLSIGNGLFTAAGTWAICDSASENDSVSESTAATPPTAGGATSDSSTFTPPATAMQAVAIKLASVAGATGTLAISFRNNTSPGSRDFTVTVNMSDLPQNTAVSPLGWFVVKNGSSVTPNGTDTYVIRIVRSVGASSCTVYASSGNNWLREVRQAAASGAAPTTGDKLIMSGEFTAAATSSTWTVTGDMTAATVYGTIAGGSITVGTKGIFSQQVTVTTTYVLNYLGRFLVAGGGIWQNAGGTAMPSDSSLTVTAQNVANVDCGIEIGALGTVTLTGKTITTLQTKLTTGVGGLCSTTSAANSVVTGLEGQSFTGLTGTIVINGVSQTILSVTNATTLTINANAGALSTVVWTHAGTGTVLNVVADTGWANSDVLCLASSTRTPGDCESVTISSISSLAVTLTAAATKYHSSDTSPNDIRAEVGNLTRNVKIQGLSATLGSYVNINATATVTLRYVEFTKQGSATALKRGIDVGTTTGSFDMQFCSIHDCTVASSLGANFGTNTSGTITFSSNVIYNVISSAINFGAGTPTIDSNLFMACASTSLGGGAYTFTNNVIAGMTSSGVVTQGNPYAITSLTGNTIHSCAGNSFTITGTGGANIYGPQTIGSNTVWRGSIGFAFGNTPLHGLWIFNGWSVFGNSTAGLQLASTTWWNIVLNAWDIRAGANLTQPIGLKIGNSTDTTVMVGTVLETCVFGGGGQTHSGGDISFVSASSGNTSRVYTPNCTFNSSTIVASQSALQPYSFVSMQRFGTTAGSHRFYTGEGTGTTDTAIFETPASRSLRITPIASANPTLRAAESAPPGMGFQVPVANGNALTVTVRVRKSVVGDTGGAAWNGNQPRLYVRRNVAAGITSDTLLATAAAANGSWETLTGVTAAVTDDSTLEFFVDSGVGVASPAGWFNVGIWQVTRSGYWGSIGLEQVWFNGFPLTGFGAPVIVRMR